MKMLIQREHNFLKSFRRTEFKSTVSHNFFLNYVGFKNLFITEVWKALNDRAYTFMGK